jgi:hypothetical protein
MPYIGNDVGILESANRHIVISVFTARHNGIGPNLEDAIGRTAEQVANFSPFVTLRPSNVFSRSFLSFPELLALSFDLGRG